MLSMLELSLRAVHFRLISQGFCTLERYILSASPCDCVNSSFQDKYRQVCTMQTVYAACSLESSSWWRTANAGCWWFCNLLTCTTVCANAFSAWTTPCASTANRMRVIFRHEHHHRVCERCQLLSLYPIDVTWSRDSEQPCHLSAVDGNCYIYLRLL